MTMIQLSDLWRQYLSRTDFRPGLQRVFFSALVVSLVVLAFFFYQQSTSVRSEFTRICRDNTHTSEDYNRCYQPYFLEVSYLQQGLFLTVLISLISGGILLITVRR
jgi:hypothetical protein